MQRILISLLSFLFVLNLLPAQINPSFNYQAVARDATGTILANQDIGLRIKLLQDGINEDEGDLVFAKYYGVATNQFGLINLVINEDNVLYGALTGLDWGKHDFYLQIEMDISATQDCNQLTGGGNCKLLGASKILTVPYAMYAAKAASIDEEHATWVNQAGNIVQNQTGNIGIGTFTPEEKLDLRGGVFFSNQGFSSNIQNIPALQSSVNDFFLFKPSDFSGADSELKLFIEDDATDRFSIYGNSCGNGGCNNLLNSKLIATFFGDGRVGLGTSAPKQRLHNIGDYYGEGHLWLFAHEGDGQDGTAYIQARDDSFTSTIDMRFRTQDAGSLIEAMHLAPNGNLGIGTLQPASKLQIKDGDIYLEDLNAGIILTSPNGNCWRVTINDNGDFEKTAVTCPE